MMKITMKKFCGGSVLPVNCSHTVTESLVSPGSSRRIVIILSRSGRLWHPLYQWENSVELYMMGALTGLFVMKASDWLKWTPSDGRK